MTKIFGQLQSPSKSSLFLGIQHDHHPIARALVNRSNTAEDREIAHCLVDLSNQFTQQIVQNVLRSFMEDAKKNRAPQRENLSNPVAPVIRELGAARAATIIGSVGNVITIQVEPVEESLEVTFTKKGVAHRTNHCTRCDRKIVEVSKRFANSIVFNCKPEHQRGGNRSHKNFTILHFKDEQGNSYTETFELSSRRSKGIDKRAVSKITRKNVANPSD